MVTEKTVTNFIRNLLRKKKTITNFIRNLLRKKNNKKFYKGFIKEKKQ